MNEISKLLATDGFITVNKTLIQLLGLHEAILIGELCSEYNYWETQDKLKDDMFFSTRDNIEKNTGLNKHYQLKAFAKLQEQGLVLIKRQGIPATNYYKINFNKLLTMLTTRCKRSVHLDVNNVYLNNNKTNNNKENKLFISKDINNSEKPIEQEVQSFVDLYHEICTDLPKIKKITDKRKKAIINIISNYKYGDIKTVFYNLQDSDFCKGKNDRGWKADIDFILREDKFINILEGKYNNPKSKENEPNKFGEFATMKTGVYTEEELESLRERTKNGQRTHF